MVRGRPRDQRAHPLRSRRRRRLRAVVLLRSGTRCSPASSTSESACATSTADRRDCGRSVWTPPSQLAPARLRQQRLGGRGAAGRLVGDRHHAGARDDRGRAFPRRSSAAGAGRRGARGQRHRHRRGDRRRTARRRLRRLGGAAGVAHAAARLARHRRARPGGDWRRPSNARASRTRSTSATPGPRSTRCARHPYDDGVAARRHRRAAAICPTASTRSSRCAGWPTTTCATTCRTSRCG